MPKPQELTPAERAAINAAVLHHLGPRLHAVADEAVAAAIGGRLDAVGKLAGRAPTSSPQMLGELLGGDAPLSVIEQCAAGGQELTVLAFPEQGELRVRGVRSFNLPFEVLVTRVRIPGTERNLLPGQIDAAVFSVGPTAHEQPPTAPSGCYPSDSRYAQAPVPVALPEIDPAEGYYRQDWGVISRHRPLEITFRTFDYPCCLPHLNWALYGEHIVAADAPLLPTPLEAADAAWKQELAEREAADAADLQDAEDRESVENPHPRAEEWACTGCTRPYPYRQHPDATEGEPNRCVDCGPPDGAPQ